jgi:hypothetical protein
MWKNTKVSVSVKIDVAACLRAFAAIVYFLN